MAAVGLSPLDILQMTTRNGTEFFGQLFTMGSVEVGKSADLVLLDANPVQDAVNLSKISAVFFKGKHLPKSALTKLKDDVAIAYGNQPAMNAVALAAPMAAEPEHAG